MEGQLQRHFFGRGARKWSQVTDIKQIPHILSDVVLEEDANTPPRMFAIDPSTGRKSLVMDLNPQFANLAFAKVEEVITGLSRLNKPVELLYIPGGVHVLEKPWDRIASQQGDVDWFCFWLNGEEDPDPAKAEQYARWPTHGANFVCGALRKCLSAQHVVCRLRTFGVSLTLIR